MSLIALAAPVWRVYDFCLIFVPFGHYDEPETLPYDDEPETLPYEIRLVCSIGADVKQSGPHRQVLKESAFSQQQTQDSSSNSAFASFKSASRARDPGLWASGRCHGPNITWSVMIALFRAITLRLRCYRALQRKTKIDGRQSASREETDQ